VDFSQLSFWHSQIAELAPREVPSDPGPFDVGIAGAGFTGLWTGIYLLKANPNLKVAIFEKEIAGFGASGRNGGWCSALFPWAADQLSEKYGKEAAKQLRSAMVETVQEVGRVTEELGIDCDFQLSGTHYLIRSEAQRSKAEHELAVAEELGVDQLRKISAELAPRATKVLGSVFDPACASIQPAKLVRGLAESFEKLGGVIFEQTEVKRLTEGRIETSRGDFMAEYVVDALEGYRSTLRGKRRDSIPIYSLMVVTEVLPEELLDEMGLEPGITFADYRNLVIYGQRTKHNRIAFGGRGAPYHFGSSIKPSYDRNDRIHDQIEEVLLDLFPQLSSVKFEQRWGGALGVSRDWMASVRLDPKSKLGQAGGYVGDGVGTSNLAGRTMADLILGLSTPITKLCWVQHQSPKWEFEPLRFVAARGALIGADVADQIEGVTGKRSLISKIIARLTGKG